MADYAEALKIFNDTVASMSGVAESQHMQTLNEINAIQASSMDPSDMGAYNLTMYGMNSVHGIQSNVINSVGNVNNYDISNLTATAVPLQVEHTSISSSLIGNFTGTENLFSHIAANPSSLLPNNNPLMLVLYGAFGIILWKFVFLSR